MFPSWHWFAVNSPPWWGWLLIVGVPLALLWAALVTLRLAERG
jgi:hypothetical protein